MSRLAQFGVFTTVTGCVVLFLGLFPDAVAAEVTPGIGIAQMIAMLSGMVLIIGGAYVAAYGMFHRGQPPSLIRSIGLRMGLTGLVFAAAATLSDAMGYGSHGGGAGIVFGWLQTVGILAGFGMAAVGVLIYGLARS